MAEGLVLGEGFATDASMIKANAQRQRSCPGNDSIDWGDPHVLVWDKSEHHDGTLSRADFRFDAEKNRYVCPAGKHLKPPQRAQAKTPLRYRASRKDCQSCGLKQRCCPNMIARKIDLSPQEPARDAARAIGKTEAYRQSRRERKKVEMLLAHVKRILKLG